ncbi:hypothetical protein M3Y98_00219300 [Aphelenchoides besseyi]|nr:hypothetical protein M3Y98_00219300 [Aphelenchoides besseyi]
MKNNVHVATLMILVSSQFAAQSFQFLSQVRNLTLSNRIHCTVDHHCDSFNSSELKSKTDLSIQPHFAHHVDAISADRSLDSVSNSASDTYKRHSATDRFPKWIVCLFGGLILIMNFLLVTVAL